MQRKNVILLDMDGCILPGKNLKKQSPSTNLKNPHAIVNHSTEDIVNYNEKLLEKQKNNILTNQYNEVILAYGSNRTDFYLDYLNATKNGNGSLVPVLPAIENFFKTALPHVHISSDFFLMADIYGNKEDGRTYKEMEAIYSGRSTLEKEKCAHSLFDSSKISLIYTHAHRAATLNPDCQITLDFYDDYLVILFFVGKFFNRHPELLPNNLILNLFHYADKKSTCIDAATTQGTGFIDTNYRSSILYLAEKFSILVSEEEKSDRRSKKTQRKILSLDNNYINENKRKLMTIPIKTSNQTYIENTIPSADFLNDFQTFRTNSIQKNQAPLSESPALDQPTTQTESLNNSQTKIESSILPNGSHFKSLSFLNHCTTWMGKHPVFTGIGIGLFTIGLLAIIGASCGFAAAPIFGAFAAVTGGVLGTGTIGIVVGGTILAVSAAISGAILGAGVGRALNKTSVNEEKKFTPPGRITVSNNQINERLGSSKQAEKNNAHSSDGDHNPLKNSMEPSGDTTPSPNFDFEPASSRPRI